MTSLRQTRVIDSRLAKELKQTPYLHAYIKNVIESLGVPTYYETFELDYDLRKFKNVNVIYPVGDGIFIHVFMPPQGTLSGYRKYIAVEPPRPDPKLMELVELKLAEAIDEKDVTDDSEEKKKLLLSKLERIVKIVDEHIDYSKLKHGMKVIPVSRLDYEYLRYYAVRDKIGLGVLEPFLRDPWIEDVTAKGAGYIYLVHKIFGPLEANIEFKTPEELDAFVIRLSERVGKPVSHARPIVDATLPDGSRLNVVYGVDVSLNGTNFTIRKFSKTPVSITQLISWNTLDERIAAYLWMLLEGNMSGFVCGESLARGEEIIVRNKRTGELEFIPIERLEDKYGEYDVLTLGENLKFVFKPIGSFIKHKPRSNIYRIETESGRVIRVTGDHSLYTIKNSRITPMLVRDLKPGDTIVVPAKLPSFFNDIRSLDLLKILLNSRLKNEVFVESNSRICNSMQYNESEVYQARIEDFLNDAECVRSSEALGDNIWIKIKGSTTRIRAHIPISEDFMRLIGLYLARGHLERGSLRFELSDFSAVNQVISLIKKVLDFNPQVTENEESLSVEINDRAVVFVFESLGVGANEQSKRIPNFMFGLGSKLLSEFLKVFLSDKAELRNNSLIVTSHSKELIKGLWYILLSFGIRAHYVSTLTGGSTSHSLVIPAKYFRVSREDEKLYFEIDDSILECQDNLCGEIQLDAVRDVSLERSYDDYVYDISVPETENFVAGFGGILAHNTASGKTTTLNAMSVFIPPTAKIVSIEDTAEVQLPHPNWVRELTRDTGSKESSVTMFDLLRSALRQRPNYIIVGEIRGAEASIAFQAMQSVSHDTPITISRSGKREVVPIGSFVDELYGDEDEKPINILGCGYRTLSLSAQGKSVWAPIKYVLRHKADEIYDILHEGGSIKATGSHSVFALDEASLEVRPKYVSKLKKGDLLVTLANRRRRKVLPLKPIVKVLSKFGLDAELHEELKHYADVGDFIDKDAVVEMLKKVKGHAYVNDKDAALLVRLNQLVDSDVSFLKVLDIKRRSYKGYVYDLSVPETELFFGGEAPVALHNTGHPVLSTFHAGSVERLIQRLTGDPINIPKTFMDNLNFALMQTAVWREGVLIRRIVSVNEILGYDPASSTIIFIPVFYWDPVKDIFIFKGRGSSFLLEEKIAVMKGISKLEMRKIYEELDMRAEFLRELTRRKVYNYYDVWKAIIKKHELGLEEALSKLKKGRLLEG